MKDCRTEESWQCKAPSGQRYVTLEEGRQGGPLKSGAEDNNNSRAMQGSEIGAVHQKQICRIGGRSLVVTHEPYTATGAAFRGPPRCVLAWCGKGLVGFFPLLETSSDSDHRSRMSRAVLGTHRFSVCRRGRRWSPFLFSDVAPRPAAGLGLPRRCSFW